MTQIPFARPSFGDKELDELRQCLESGWITSGPRVAEFEKKFAQYVGAPGAVAVSCGTSALYIALSLIGVGPGDEVITPSMTWVSVPNLVALLGATPVFCDVDAATLNMDLDHVESLITPRTKAIVPVHYSGRPVDLERLGALAAKHGITVLEDACHASGAGFGGKRIGAHSPLCAFSFHPNKNMTTGEGGMLTGNDAELIEKARLLRFHGVSRDTFKRLGNGSLPHYESLFPALKLNMTDMAASLGLHQLDKLDGFNAVRAERVALYRELLAERGVPVTAPPEYDEQGGTHSWHLFIVQTADEPGLRDGVMQDLLGRGIQTGLHYMPVHLMPTAAPYAEGLTLPVTERLGRTVMSLPLFPDMTGDQVAAVVDALADSLEHRLSKQG